jgi:chromosome segregation ATPase
MPSEEVVNKLSELQSELDRIASAVRQLDKAADTVIDTSKLLDEIPTFVNELRELETSLMNNLLSEHKKKIDSTADMLDSLKNELEKKDKNIAEGLENSKKVQSEVSALANKIDKVDFPSRLDKIDNQISAINIGIGNTQSALQSGQEKTEKLLSSFSEELHQIEQRIAKKQSVELNRIDEKIGKSILTNTIISVVGLLTVLCLLVYQMI